MRRSRRGSSRTARLRSSRNRRPGSRCRMTSPRRKQLNHDIRALAHGFLRLDEETYRGIVETITGKRHVTDCDDEEANLILLALKRMKDNTGAGPRIETNGRQQRFIA